MAIKSLSTLVPFLIRIQCETSQRVLMRVVSVHIIKMATRIDALVMHRLTFLYYCVRFFSFSPVLQLNAHYYNEALPTCKSKTFMIDQDCEYLVI